MITINTKLARLEPSYRLINLPLLMHKHLGHWRLALRSFELLEIIGETKKNENLIKAHLQSKWK